MSEQLLSHHAHRGHFASRSDSAVMSQIYRIRQVLEAAVLRSIRWPEPEGVGALHDAMQRAIGHVQRGDGRGALQTVREVSLIIFWRFRVFRG